MIVRCFIFGILLQAVGITLTVVAFVHMEPLFFLGLVPMYIGTALIGIAAIKVEEYVMNLNERVKGKKE